MPVVTSLRESGVPATDYYAPNFKVEVEGRELDPDAKGDVLDVKVTMDLENLTSFDLTINNWDDKRFAFKYSDTTIFDVGNRVHVRMGYADDLRFMASGLISALTPKFPESGPPTLGVTGVDAMLKLRDRKPVGSDVKKFVDPHRLADRPGDRGAQPSRRQGHREGPAAAAGGAEEPG